MYNKEDVKRMFGKGHHKLIDKLFDRIKPEQIDYIKSKYGRIDIYIRGSDEEQDFCLEISQESEMTCEECGEPGELKEINGWISALCDKCYENRNKR